MFTGKTNSRAARSISHPTLDWQSHALSTWPRTFALRLKPNSFEAESGRRDRCFGWLRLLGRHHRSVTIQNQTRSCASTMAS